jgi:hypothetical protein
MWRFVRSGSVPTEKLAVEALVQLDKWLTNRKADTSTQPLQQKVVKANPATVFDQCRLASGASQSTKVSTWLPAMRIHLCTA